MRERLYALVRKADRSDGTAKLYNYFIVIVAFLSLLPLMSKAPGEALRTIDIITVYILFADYVFRWITHDYTSGRANWKAFVIYPFTPMAIIDLVSLLPSMVLLSPGFKILRLFRVFKILRYSENFTFIGKVIKRERKVLQSVLYITLFYIFVTSIAMFTSETQNFEDYFDALYWAATAFARFGHDGVHPISNAGKVISVLASLSGFAIITLPVGIVIAAFVEGITTLHKNEFETELKIEPHKTLAEEFGAFKSFAARPGVKHYALVMLISVAMNEGLKKVGDIFNLPVWLDVTGTAFATLMLGISAGLIVGLINNMYLAITEYGVSSLFYYSISALVAVTTGALLKKGSTITIKNTLLTIVIIILGSSFLDATVDVFISKGPVIAKIEPFYHVDFFSGREPYHISNYLGAFVVTVLDTLASALCVAVFYVAAKRLPFRLKKD